MTIIKHLDVQLGAVTEHNLQQLKMLNVTTLPVRYTDKFYHDLVINSPPELIKLGIYISYTFYYYEIILFVLIIDSILEWIFRYDFFYFINIKFNN